MKTARFYVRTCPDDIKEGICAIAENRKDFSASPENSLQLDFVEYKELNNIEYSQTVQGKNIRISYSCKTAAFRAIGRLLGESQITAQFTEKSHFETVGAMIDASRNGVLKVSSAKKFIQHCALMGINMLMLYCEDTYEIPDEPFFGYLRGAYTYDELKEIDNYADLFGIQVIPCIQTLAHLEQMLHWPGYSELKDRDGILLAGEEKTYEFIEKMIVAASAPFRSRRIHIGMDEAHGIGTGRYKEKNGARKTIDIMLDHLVRVDGICKHHGLQPMIWSDMLFHIDSKPDSAYSEEATPPSEAIERIPADIDLVGWFYGGDTKSYEYWIERHRETGFEPVIAGGILTWNRFWALLPEALDITESCMLACRNKGVKEVFMTMWGDDGMECDIFSALPGLQFFAEHAYSEIPQNDRIEVQRHLRLSGSDYSSKIDTVLLKKNFRGSCNADFDDWMLAAELDIVPSAPSVTTNNIGKWLLWQDPLLALLEPEFEDLSLREHYEKLSESLSNAAKKDGASRLEFPALIAQSLALKCNLHREMQKAYKSGDGNCLKKLIDGDLRRLRSAVRALWIFHRKMWLETYKPFGLEVLEQRYGGLMTRLESLSMRIEEFLADGREIPELSIALHRIFTSNWDYLPYVDYKFVKTPSTIK